MSEENPYVSLATRRVRDTRNSTEFINAVVALRMNNIDFRIRLGCDSLIAPEGMPDDRAEVRTLMVRRESKQYAEQLMRSKGYQPQVW